MSCSVRAQQCRRSTLNFKAKSPRPGSAASTASNSDFFSIRIRDEGGGVSPSNMARIFSYAFTTAKSDADDDFDGGGGPYAAQHVGGAGPG
ncbi:hypothetical protein C8F04DRAFT_1115631 [Mycena alexandri]|uniref:Protein-serine/threonine kinase n=1 Tax=Mycena alexandri TaxID=1745969 RepID=A0AAD6X2E9_9AGAR|nr:hypothetical protein C8F04DRAFT_1115631 [Mycena alexandri]